MNNNLKLFISAMIQVSLVGAQTIFIPRLFWPGIVIVGFGISFFWTYNVKRIAFATLLDRIIYSSGALCGMVIGVVIAHLITK